MSLRHSDVGYQVDVVSPFLVLSGSHYIDENIMAISAFSQAVLKGFDDPETGCVSHDQVAFQSCRQAYFLKQQNQILQNQQQQSNEILRQENTGLKTQAAKIQSELDALKTQPTSTATTGSSVQPQMGVNGNGNVIVFSLLLIIAILATVIITKHFSKK
ncbi:MAG: hypothetical protein A3C93_05550 [Candidatus Lloydbacteria bacterium RIFCSPHIGHO2_02_FULL_54_17]|uniref:Uncharacterized protein n=1 Tax=Candidatus Lloydbacteria bacterium RIFCSPHIGHO2_02_FULL_54_17 TaxID=1798664 RepID=A0A1G2DBB3_9BACT|nr:MAG: hypothetical protein A3C93_05550 [Candidatus Lloydbacteria bacterium RIFCSPHIGHO2_02_FULL_54_17]OGZ13053.1 MAG: hypothetical protein A2948_03530 [Candidatus Lloydbacteria bacterium RIFCSPLOWO2_01_FULL_54_18]OGZ16501.1 MAG: hypothetical protein A3H76_04390 [Candidatus Lloydbacteria bacterium RIFCSPLOWO2_02_FULL_54_12]